MPIYKRRFYRTAKKERDQNQHGWARKSLRQYFCGAALEECEVRGYLSEGISNDGRSKGGFKTLFSVLQQRATSSIAWLPNTEGSVHGENRVGKGIHLSALIYKKGRRKESKKQVIKTKNTVLTMGSTIVRQARLRLLLPVPSQRDTGQASYWIRPLGEGYPGEYHSAFYALLPVGEHNEPKYFVMRKTKEDNNGRKS